jgi:outer membrane protein assembly factor BamB
VEKEQVFPADPYRSEFATAVSKTLEAERGYILTGRGNREGNYQDLLLVKTDLEGTELWSRRFGREDYFAEGRDVLSLDDSGYLAGGWKRVGDGFSQIWLLNTDSNGTEIPEESAFFDQYQWSSCNAMIPIDGGYLITGETWGDLLIIKTDNGLSEDWNATFESSSGLIGEGHWAAEVEDGYVVAGMHNNRVALIKVDSNGDEVWRTLVPGEGQNKALAGDITLDGGFVVVGYKETNI